MEKIKLNSGKVFNIIPCGIISSTEAVTISFLPEGNSLDVLNTLFLNINETQKIILLSEHDEELAIYNGYTKLTSIGQELDAKIGYTDDEAQTLITGKVVTVTMHKSNLIEQRISAAEAQLTDIQLALCEVYEML